DPSFANDGKTLFYVTSDPQTKRPNKLFRHVLGQPSAKDTLVFDETDPRFELDCKRSRSGEQLVCTSWSMTMTEVRLLPLSEPARPPRVVLPREAGHEYYVEPHGAFLYVRTNSGGARNFRVVTAPLADPRPPNWKEIVPHQSNVMLEDL